ncbi:MAG TPA: hypothetical protein VF310_06935 [Vicinamibacteria bacterium]
MGHKVRVELPPDVRAQVEQAVWAALAACPEDDPWEVALVQDVMAPHLWEAVAAGPKVDPGGAWEVLSASGRWRRRPDTLYTRVFEGPEEQQPGYVNHCFHELFRCFEQDQA